MAQERIDIVINERGSRVVKRNLDGIGRSARGASSGVELLKRTMAALGVGFAVRELGRLADQYTNLQNKLRAVGHQGKGLTSTWQQLLDISNETRQSLDGTVTIYSRVAASANDLGRTYEEVVDFTRQLNYAVATSGATAVEAENAMIQLAQGLASGALRGDELRSVLEQLPTVADVIAQHLGVTRGRLRELGMEGKITANAVIDAFNNAEGELRTKFLRAIPTIGQAFQVLRNQAVNAIGEIDKRLGVSASLTSVIITLAGSMDELADTVVTLTRVLGVAAAAYAAFWAANKVGNITAAVSAWLEYRNAIAAGTAVALGSAEAERQKAAASVAAATADAEGAAAVLRKAQAEEAHTAAALASVRATQAQLVAERNLEIQRLKAQITTVGRTKSLTRLAEVRRAEVAITNQVAAAEARLSASQTATAAAQQASAASASRLATAQGALGAATARAAGTTSLLGQAVSAVRGGIVRLFAVISAHPIGALVTALAAVVAALTLWRDEINLGVDDMTTLGDLMRAIGEQISTAFDTLLTSAQEVFGPLGTMLADLVGDFEFSLAAILRLTARIVDGFVGYWRGAFQAVITMVKGLPEAAKDGLEGLKQLGRDSAAAFKEGFESSTAAQDTINGLITRAQEIARERAAAAKANGNGDGGNNKGDGSAVDDLKSKLDALVGSYDRVFAANQEYRAAVKLLDQAEKANLITAERKAEVLGLIEEQLKDARDPLAAINRELTQELDLLRMSADEREIETQLRQVQQDLLRQGVVLGEEELTQLRQRLELIQGETKAAAVRNAILDSTKAKRQEEIRQLEVLNQLIAAGDITKSQGTGFLVEKNPDMFAGTVEAQEEAMARIQEGYDKIRQWREADLISEQTASQMKQKLDYEQYQQRLGFSQKFFGTLAGLQSSSNKEIAQAGKAAAVIQATIDGVLAVQKALASAPPPYNYALASAVGAVQAANVAEIASQPLPGYKTGGEFMVGGSGGADSQLVAFRATPNERVTVDTPEQRRKKDRAPETNVSVPLKVVNVIDPKEALSAMQSAEGERLIINTIQRNPGTIRKLLS